MQSMCSLELPDHATSCVTQKIESGGVTKQLVDTITKILSF